MEEVPSSPSSLVVSSPRRTLSLLRERRATVSVFDPVEKAPGFAEEHGPKPSEVYGFVGSITTVIATGTPLPPPIPLVLRWFYHYSFWVGDRTSLDPSFLLWCSYLFGVGVYPWTLVALFGDHLLSQQVSKYALNESCSYDFVGSCLPFLYQCVACHCVNWWREISLNLLPC